MAGYDVEVYKDEVAESAGYFWHKSGYIFKSYIGNLYKDKKTSKGAKRALLKLFMNSLFGKMLQQSIHQVEQYIDSSEDWWKFFDKNEITSWTDYDNGVIRLTGIDRDIKKLENNVTKPSHLGVFILAYSRQIMTEYYKKANPSFNISRKANRRPTDLRNLVKEQIRQGSYYGDTDSFQVHSEQAEYLEIDETGEILGALSNDLEKDAKILESYYINKKFYADGYITRNSDKPLTDDEKERVKQGTIEIKNGKKIYWHRRAAGIPELQTTWIEGKSWEDDVKETKATITPSDYRKISKGKVLKVKGSSIFKKHGAKYGENPFSISFEQSLKSVKQNANNGRTFITIDGIKGSLPFGHDYLPTKQT